MSQVALGIDVGTGSTKAGLVDAEGRLLGTARATHAIDEPRPGWSETDPRAWLESTRSAIGQVLERHPTASVSAIGLSGQMHGVVLCDDAGTPVRPAVLWPDRRAEPLLADWGERLRGAREALANPLVPGMAGPVLGALLASEPAVVANARWALQPKDWLRLRLTGEVATDPSDASATLLWDVPQDRWSEQAAGVFGVDPQRLPPVRPSDATGGRLEPEVADLLELPSGLPIAVGAADTAAALFGAGLAVGETQVSTGTGGQIATLVEEPAPDPTLRTHLYRAIGSHFYAMAAIQNAGLAIDWALQALGVPLVDAEAALRATPPGARGASFLPYLTGERTPHLDPTLSAGWYGLRPDVDRACLVRAIFEGVAFALRDGLDALRAVGHDVEVALLAGGGSLAPWWRQLLADALGIPLVTHDAVDASVRGAALLGWRAIGVPVPAAAHVTRGPAIEPRSDDLEAPLVRFRDLAARARGSGG